MDCSLYGKARREEEEIATPQYDAGGREGSVHFTCTAGVEGTVLKAPFPPFTSSCSLCLLQISGLPATPGHLMHLGCSCSHGDRREAFFHELIEQEINGQCWRSWSKHGCQLDDTVACTQSFNFHHCFQFLEGCSRVQVLWETCMEA